MKVNKIVEEQEIGDEKEKVAKFEKETKTLVSQKFYKQIYIFRKKVSEKMPIKKVQNYVIKVKKGFVLRQGNIYLLSREEREKIYEFIEEKLRKEYIRPLKSPQMTLVFFVGKKDDNGIGLFVITFSLAQVATQAKT